MIVLRGKSLSPSTLKTAWRQRAHVCVLCLCGVSANVCLVPCVMPSRTNERIQSWSVSGGAGGGGDAAHSPL
jgi:hypothetical protein